MRRVAILDVCSGNLRSVERALVAANEAVLAGGGEGHEVAVTQDAAVLAQADAVVMPGQGAFGVFRAAMDAGGYEAPLRAFIATGKPYLGICLGMQILFDASEEQGLHQGLGLVPGVVRKFVPTGEGGAPRKVPHIGWNQVMWSGGRVGVPANHPVVSGLTQGEHLYFVHSYFAELEVTEAAGTTLGACDYDGAFCAAVAAKNVVGVQFHPEKSHAAGLRLLSNFLRWRP